MIAELGVFFLIAACVFAMHLILSPVLVPYDKLRATAWFRRQALGQFLCISASFLLLAVAFWKSDFSLIYVTAHSNTELPNFYKVAAVWGGHEGSLLLWLLILALWTVIAAYHSTFNRLKTEVIHYFACVLGILSGGFIGFILLTSNPFLVSLPQVASNGADLNPLLQDIGLIIHPPILYTGYVGFVLSFAYAMALLLACEFSTAAFQQLRPWVLGAWVFLTFGITLGSWWAYYELGWGGWWFWDPVENASLMPWLVGSALLHSVMLSSRGQFVRWTIILAIMTFSLSVFGTFLVRSGVLTSVHAFANDPKRGFYLLTYLAVMTFAALTVYLYRSNALPDNGNTDLRTRPGLLLLNNLLLLAIFGTVFLGTIYPLVLEALNLGKISVGPPYFNTVLAPIGLVFFVLMALAPNSKWRYRHGDYFNYWHGFVILISVMAALFIPLYFNQPVQLPVFLGLAIAFWLIINTLKSGIESVQSPLSQQAMTFAHLGAGILLIGVTCTSYFSTEKDLRFALGQTQTVAGYDVQLTALDGLVGPNYSGVKASFSVKHDNQWITNLFPEKRVYHSNQMSLSETAIHVGLFRDIYIALGEPLGKNSWAVRVYHKPFVRWLWAGGLLMMLGGFCALLGAWRTARRQDVATD